LYKRVKPWIAAVDGVALGGGCELALACDMIVASETSVFALPETSRGLLAAAGGMYRLPRVLPRNIALELVASGAQLPATRAHAFGMVNRLTATGGAVAEALELARAICGNAPIAVQESLRIARAAQDLDEDALQAMTYEAQRGIVETEDYKEGPRAFLEKRLPVWSGR
jgi:enoyl-CoA hydratase/carnithine racemase